MADLNIVEGDLEVLRDRTRIVGEDLESGPVRKLLTVCLCGCCPGRLV